MDYIAVTYARTRHIINTRVVCCTPRTLRGCVSSFANDSTPTFIIALTKCSVCLYSNFSLLFSFSSFYFVKTIVHTKLCQCFFFLYV